MKDQFPPTGGGINLFRDALKSDVPVVEMGNCFNEMFEGAAQPIQPPDNEGIPFPDILQRLLEAFALRFCPADDIGVDFGAPDLLQGIFLQIKGLFAG